MNIRPDRCQTGTSRRIRAATLLALGALGATACDPLAELGDDARQAAEAGLDQAREAADLVQFCAAAVRVAAAISDQDVEAAVAAGTDLVEHAPADISVEAQVVLDAALRARDGDTAALGSAETRDAAAALQAYTTDRCDPR